jgi:hypothetical protein
MIARNLKFRMDNIEIIHSALNAPTQQAEVSAFNFEVQTQMKLEAHKKQILVFIGVAIHTQQPVEVIGKYTACCCFLIENFEEIVIKNQFNHLEVPDNVIDTLNSISISTIRGLMFGAFKGTFLHHAILPIVDPKAVKSNGK